MKNSVLVQPRDYQSEMIGGVRACLRRVKRVLLQSPTGSGKTVIASFIISQTAARGEPAWFICHRAELVDGTSKTFHKYGITHGIIGGGYPLNLRQLVQVCSIDTLKNRLAHLAAPRIAIIDEAHHCAAAGWAVVVAWLHSHGTLIIGLSATPERLDGKGLREHFDDMVLGPSVQWLMDEGYLAKYRIYAPSSPDMTGIRKQMGDFAKGQTAERMDKPKLTGDMISHWFKQAKGLRTLAFAVTVPHSQHIVDQFNHAGIRALHLDGSTPKTERKRGIDRYANGEIDVLSNVGLFGEGFDLSAVAQRDVTIDAVIDAAPTMSLAAYRQRGGRLLRPEDYVKVYLDHAGNSNRHGYFEDDYEWSLDGRSKGKGANDNGPPPPVTCPKCFQQVRRPLPLRCYCGHVFDLAGEAKPIEVADEDLEEKTADERKATRLRLAREQAECKDLGALVALGKSRGHKYPTKWAQHVFGARRYKNTPANDNSV